MHLPSRLLIGFGAGLAALAIAGCTPDHNTLSLRSDDGHALFQQDFSVAHAATLADGSVHLILADDGFGQQPESKGQPVAISNQQPLRQVVHIRLFWNTTNSAPKGDPSATNAAIDWYLTQAGGGDAKDRLHYHGAGWVTFSSDSDGVTASIKSASLSPAEIHGDMKDPVGASKLNGTFRADWNEEYVRNVVAQVQSQPRDNSMVLGGSTSAGPTQRE